MSRLSRSRLVRESRNAALATKRYEELLVAVRAKLARLQDIAGEDFGYSSDQVGWGEVGDLFVVDEQLGEICDRVFHEGEFAESE